LENAVSIVYKKKLPDSARYIPMILSALRSLGGDAKAADVRQWIAEQLAAHGEEVPETTLNSGAPKFANDIQWARMYLVNASLLEPMKTAGYGKWKLTRDGWSFPLGTDSARTIFELTANKGKEQNSDTQDAPDDPVQGELKGTKSWEFVLKGLLTSMPHQGFERLCAALMMKNGLAFPKVTGKSGDGGIDGEGMLPIDDFGLIRAPVAWQCKRFKDGSVGSQAVRDFRGSIEGRARYGLIFTSSTFTTSAELEARRPGATPIELVDLETLINLMGSKGIGITKSCDVAGGLEIDSNFFEPFLVSSSAQDMAEDLLSKAAGHS